MCNDQLMIRMSGPHLHMRRSLSQRRDGGILYEEDEMWDEIIDQSQRHPELFFLKKNHSCRSFFLSGCPCGDDLLLVSVGWMLHPFSRFSSKLTNISHILYERRKEMDEGKRNRRISPKVISLKTKIGANQRRIDEGSMKGSSWDQKLERAKGVVWYQ